MKCLAVLTLCIFLTSAEDVAVQDFIKANNLFAPSVYEKISKADSGNFLVSPFSIETVLAFAQSGCRGETAQELRSSLHLPDDQEKIGAAVKSLLPKLKGNSLYTLNSANKMYIKDKVAIKDDFKKAAVDVYAADSETIDFSKNIDAAKTMNQWVEKQTNDKIKNLINPNDLDDLTEVVLVNALYFKADWATPFLLSLTGKTKFYKTSADVVQVETLHQFGAHFNYYENSDLKAQFLELPFKGDEASMVIVLPNEKEGLAALETQIDKVFAPQEFKTEYINVALPKFKIESTLSLKNVLAELGVRKIFNASEADLSGVAGSKGDLVVSQVAQKTFIDVSEEGVEAAAATYVVIPSLISAQVEPVKPQKTFIADHPFIFYIKAKDVILFAGKVTDPHY